MSYPCFATSSGQVELTGSRKFAAVALQRGEEFIVETREFKNDSDLKTLIAIVKILPERTPFQGNEARGALAYRLILSSVDGSL